MSNEKKPLDPNDPITRPIPRQPSFPDRLVDSFSEKILPNVKVPLDKRYAKLSIEQKKQLEDIEERAIIHFVGQLDELESAIGMMRLGHHVGWKVLYMIHSKKTIRKYEEILDIKIRNIFPDKGPSADRSIGLGLAEKFSNFWKVVSGEVKIEHRREIQ